MAGVKINPEDTSEQAEVRWGKLAKLKEVGYPIYPNDFKPTHNAAEVISRFGSLSDEGLAETRREIRLAGRIMAIRYFGKASFFHIQDRRGRLQVYARKERLGDQDYALFESLDVGDIVGTWGHLFRTRTKELTLEAHGLCLLAKCLRPLPEKWHGLADVEVRYR
jgi:lysyl-tRNA synthetase class 2